MTASQLGLFNDALQSHLGERKLLNLSENREPRRALDEVYASVLDECLEEGYWKHARRTVQLTASDSLTPAFGFQYVFDQPSDCLQVYLVSLSADGSPPLNHYAYENGFIRADSQTIYLTYISNDASFGTIFSKWAPSFGRYVAACLAARVCYRLTQNAELTETIKKEARRLKKAALSRDAMEGPSLVRPSGSWVQSRGGGSGVRPQAWTGEQ